MRRLTALLFVLIADTVAGLMPGMASAQTGVALGGLSVDPSAEVEVTADSLTVDRAGGGATFAGNVVIGQGEMRLSAARVEVTYDEASGDITRLAASGGVTLATASEAAEAEEAVYDLTAGTVTMTGEVLLTQGGTALSSERMVVDIASGNAQLDGRVRTVLNPDAP